MCRRERIPKALFSEIHIHTSLVRKAKRRSEVAKYRWRPLVEQASELARLKESASALPICVGLKSLLLSQLLRFLVYEVGTVIPAS